MSLADAYLVMSELIGGISVFILDSNFKIYRQNKHQAISLIKPD
jgi:hypothetical protein